MENSETYESSFYKRTLDNEIYIFTAPSFTSKFSERFICVYVITSLCMKVFSVVWHRAYPALCLWTSSQPHWQRSHSRASDITLFILLLFPLCLSALTPTLPCTVCFLLSPLISLADIRTGKCQCNVAALQLHLTGLTHVLASQTPLHSHKVKLKCLEFPKLDSDCSISNYGSHYLHILLNMISLKLLR